ncbi:MAG TPA: hypothetical protein VJP90_12630 [Paenarthrobacter sp.]|nr:hypothetical protein [Paenarthrobacter sp.]
MCELPKRRWRSSVTPLRFLVGVLALGTIAFGWLAPAFPWGFPVIVQAAVLMGAGFLALAVAVFMPIVREVELGLTPSVKLGPAIRDRQAELRSVFEQQKGDLEYCAHLLCGDPEQARRMLEAAWSQASSAWRGPVTPQLRVHTLCLYVELLRKYDIWLGTTEGRKKSKRDRSILAGLTHHQRVAVVLHEFAKLTVAEIAGITERPVAEVAKTLAAAEAKTQHLALERGKT